jgi:bifunctional enzyme CysN/CysC
MEMVRMATAGSVDDGKSTLIGRLLYDSKAIFDDQLSAVEAASAASNDDYTNQALLTDGLRADREQGITIDVAYRYFSTPARKFIIADTPGHLQYTRNMVTGASTADVAVILVDARKGVLEQSRRHAYLCSLLRVPHMVLCVNKMDLVDWSADVFTVISTEFRTFAESLNLSSLSTVPVSALNGDNIVSLSENAPWYDGQPLLPYLETNEFADDSSSDSARLPVQHVIRHGDEVRYAGQIASGELSPGQEVTVLPSGATSRLSAVYTADGPRDCARAPLSVSVQLEDQIELSRGDMICAGSTSPAVTQDIEATVCWMDENTPLTPDAEYTIKHTTRTGTAVVTDLLHRIDVNDLGATAPASELNLNEIGRVRLHTSIPLVCDDYSHNRATGGFILIENESNRTVAGGIIATC